MQPNVGLSYTQNNQNTALELELFNYTLQLKTDEISLGHIEQNINLQITYTCKGITETL
jgi:hypothetical protein